MVNPLALLVVAVAPGVAFVPLNVLSVPISFVEAAHYGASVRLLVHGGSSKASLIASAEAAGLLEACPHLLILAARLCGLAEWVRPLAEDEACHCHHVWLLRHVQKRCALLQAGGRWQRQRLPGAGAGRMS